MRLAWSAFLNFNVVCSTLCPAFSFFSQQAIPLTALRCPCLCRPTNHPALPPTHVFSWQVPVSPLAGSFFVSDSGTHPGFFRLDTNFCLSIGHSWHVCSSILETPLPQPAYDHLVFQTDVRKDFPFLVLKSDGNGQGKTPSPK